MGGSVGFVYLLFALVNFCCLSYVLRVCICVTSFTDMLVFWVCFEFGCLLGWFYILIVELHFMCLFNCGFVFAYCLDFVTRIVLFVFWCVNALYSVTLLLLALCENLCLLRLVFILWIIMIKFGLWFYCVVLLVLWIIGLALVRWVDFCCFLIWVVVVLTHPLCGYLLYCG